MSVPWKDELYNWIVAQPDCSTNFDLWTDDVLRRFPTVRIRKTSLNNVVINLSGKGQWYDPQDWCRLHRVNLLRQLDDVVDRLTYLDPQVKKGEKLLVLVANRSAGDLCSLLDAHGFVDLLMEYSSAFSWLLAMKLGDQTLEAIVREKITEIRHSNTLV